MIAQANRYTSGDDAPPNADGTPNLQYQQLARQKAAADVQESEWAKDKAAENDAVSQFGGSVGQSQQVWNALDRIYRNFGSDRWSDDFNEAIGKLNSVPGLRAALAPGLAQWHSAQDEAHKEAARQTIVTALGNSLSGGAPAEAMHMAKLQVPTPGMAAGARYDVMAQNRALLQQQNDWAHVWNANKRYVDDPSSFKTKWFGEHPVTGPGGYEERAYNSMFPYAGMRTQEMDAHPRRPTTQADLNTMWNTYPAGIPVMINGKLYHTPGARR
jgi:hypothetical protein